MMIVTHYVGPTDFKPGRVVAAANLDRRYRVVVSWDHSLSIKGNHDHAAWALLREMDKKMPEYASVRAGAYVRLYNEGGGYTYFKPYAMREAFEYQPEVA